MPEDLQRRPAFVVAVDGPSGSGKSSVSRGIATMFGFRYLDTGAMYRAVAWWLLRNNIDVNDGTAVAGQIPHVHIENGTDPQRPFIMIDGTDASQEIREQFVTSAVSAVSAVPEVREAMVAAQRAEVLAAQQADVGIVVEGRDIGTTVLPEADLKIFLTADNAARAARRAAQDNEEGRAAQVGQTAADLAARDAADSSRKASPLTQADDAVVIDATKLGFDQVVAEVERLVSEGMEK
ncbi:MAG: (d)CMP kinase [Actinobacteria bacterium]|nr:(d)CMP kinase [Actinomycetota bacterium]